MKNILFLLSFIFLISFTGRAQEIFIGAKGGLNISNISNDKDNHAKLGFHLGGYGGYKFNEKMAGSLELLYSQKGTHHKGPVVFNGRSEPQNGDVMVHIDYIDIPLLFHYYFSPNFNVHGGITIGAPIRGVRAWRYPAHPPVSFIDAIDKSVASFPLGITYEINGFNLGLRADLGLTKIGNDQRKNIVLMFSVGYSFFRKAASIGSGKGSSSKEDKK